MLSLIMILAPDNLNNCQATFELHTSFGLVAENNVFRVNLHDAAVETLT